MMRFSLAQVPGACKEVAKGSVMLQSFKIRVLLQAFRFNRKVPFRESPPLASCAFSDTTDRIVSNVVAVIFPTQRNLAGM
jgi:hypothetical protein